MKSKYCFLVLLLTIFSVDSVCGGSNKPNIIFILADDQPYDYLGCTGNQVAKTPNLDKLAEEGILFTNAHITSAICTPSRVSIFLSQFERKHGVNFNSGTSVAPEAWEKSYPVVMRQNGYYTGYVGKNHSPIGEGGYSSTLMEKSFDYWYCGHGHLGFYPKDRHEIFKGAKNDTQLEVLSEGIDDFLGEKNYELSGAVHFLEERPDDKPFCLSICLNLPHGASTGTMQMREKDDEMYKSLFRDLEIALPENYIAQKEIKEHKIPLEIHHVEDRQKGYDWVNTPETFRERYIRHMQTTTGIDVMVGKILKKLEENNLAENTIVIYSSDHGLFNGEFGLGGKALCYEQCTKVPLIVYNPMVPKKAKGKQSDELVSSIDIAATMLAYAGIEQPESFQGKDVSSLINGADMEVRKYLFTENLWSTQFGNPRCESVQTKEWKYIRYYKNENLSAQIKIDVAEEMGINQNVMLYAVHDPDIALYRSFIEAPIKGEKPVYEELFNLKNDPEESTNLFLNEENDSIRQELRTACNKELLEARGKGKAKVLRYTKDSQMENQAPVPHE